MKKWWKESALRQQENGMEQKELYDRLRCGYESPDFELYGVPDKDPMGCAAQVRDVLIPVLQRLSKDAGLI